MRLLLPSYDVIFLLLQATVIVNHVCPPSIHHQPLFKFSHRWPYCSVHLCSKKIYKKYNVNHWRLRETILKSLAESGSKLSCCLLSLVWNGIWAAHPEYYWEESNVLRQCHSRISETTRKEIIQNICKLIVTLQTFPSYHSSVKIIRNKK